MRQTHPFLSRMLIAIACLLLGLSAFVFQVRIASPMTYFEDIERLSPLQIRENEQKGISVSLYLFREAIEDRPLAPAALLMVLGGGLLIFGLSLSPIDLSRWNTVDHPFSLKIKRWLMLGAGITCLWILAESNGQLFKIGLLENLTPPMQFMLLCAGILLVAWGMGSDGIHAVRSIPRPKTDFYLLIAIIFLGLVLRVRGLDSTIRVLVDEVHYTSAANEFFKRDDVKIIAPMTRVSPFPYLYAYAVAGASEIFGRSLVGARIASAILGTLTIPALYVLAKTLFDRQTALLAALLLATFPPHVHFSRLSMLHVCDALSGTLALAFLARGLRYNRRLDYAISGAALGMTQYFYEGGRLAFPAIAILWLTSGFLFWEKRPSWRGIFILAVTALLIAAPVYYVIAGAGTPTTGRLNTVGVGENYLKRVLVASPEDDIFKAQRDRVLQAFLVYLGVPDSSLFYAGNTPLLLVYIAPFFLMGMFYLVSRWRGAAFWLLFFALLIPPMGTSLLVESGISVRLVAIFPLLILPAAVGGHYVLTHLLPPDEKIQGIVIAFIFIGLAMGQIAYYFEPHLQVFNQQFRIVKPYPDGEDAILRSLDLPDGTQLILISDPVFPEMYGNEILNYYRPEIRIRSLRPQDMTENFMQTLPCDRPHYFYISLQSGFVIEQLKTRFLLSDPVRSPNADTIPDLRELVLFKGYCR